MQAHPPSPAVRVSGSGGQGSPEVTDYNFISPLDISGMGARPTRRHTSLVRAFHPGLSCLSDPQRILDFAPLRLPVRGASGVAPSNVTYSTGWAEA